MFDDNYKNQIDNIKPDKYIKQKVLRKIEENGNSKSKPKTLVFRTMTAVAMIAIMFVSLFAVDSFIKNPLSVANEESAETSYKDIYKALKKLNSTKLNGGIYEYVTDDEAIDIAEGDMATSTTVAGTNKNSSSSNVKEDAEDISETNEQVKGVDEADIVKTDGKYIYVYSPKNLAISIVSTSKEAKKVSQIELEEKGYYFSNEMFVKNGRLVLLTRKTVENKSYTTAMIYNIENPEKPEKLYECRQSGEYKTSRLIGNTLYLISKYRVNTSSIEKDKYETYVPVVTADN
ncbi:MAG: beta-propeller domain-containing protein, partial [Clostridia bacterium]|nr:beta-propeller domain-containing protein [Clostridia bacterium]